MVEEWVDLDIKDPLIKYVHGVQCFQYRHLNFTTA